jgi:hypothetical protein
MISVCLSLVLNIPRLNNTRNTHYKPKVGMAGPSFCRGYQYFLSALESMELAAAATAIVNPRKRFFAGGDPSSRKQAAARVEKRDEDCNMA